MCSFTFDGISRERNISFSSNIDTLIAFRAIIFKRDKEKKEKVNTMPERQRTT
jgi:hypothetical protein